MNVNSDTAAIARNGGTWLPFQKVIALTLLTILGLLPTRQNIRLTLIVTNYLLSIILQFPGVFDKQFK